jgi:protein SCO1
VRRLLPLLLLVLLPPYGRPAAAQESRWLPQQRFDPAQDVGIDQRLGARLPLETPFLDEEGAPVRLSAYFGRGRPALLVLIYYECPMLCTLEVEGLVRGLRGLTLDPGRDFELIVVSIDPRETPALAKARKNAFLGAYQSGGPRPGAAEGLHFLTGTKEAIDALAGAVGFRYAYDAPSDEFAHAAGIAVATPAGVLSHYLLGIDFRPRDLRLALVESSGGRVGSPVDQLLLLCFHYDPATGRYGMAIFAALRLAGIATAAGLVLFVLRNLLRERRVRRAEA